MVHIKDGASCLFWEDIWSNRVPKQQYPEVFSFAKKKHISFRKFLGQLPISTPALQQLIILAEDIENLHVTTKHDLWTYIWGTPYFTSGKAYLHLTDHIPTNAAFKWLWNSVVQCKHKVFC